MFYKNCIPLLVICVLVSLLGCGDPDSTIEDLEQDPMLAAAPPFIPQCPSYLYKNTSRMRYIPSGTFTMGGAYELKDYPTPEWQAHTKGFYMDTHEVTIGDFLFFVEVTGYETHPLVEIPHHSDAEIADHVDYEAHPVRVMWDDAVAYAAWVGKRLPTEVEWEKAARGGKSGDIAISTAYGNIVIRGLSGISRNPWDDGFMFNDQWSVVPTGSYIPNPYGLFDMIGNLSEWCSDDWNTNAYLLMMNGMEVNPDPNEKYPKKVIRGGGIRHNVDMVSTYGSRINQMDADKQQDFKQTTGLQKRNYPCRRTDGCLPDEYARIPMCFGSIGDIMSKPENRIEVERLVDKEKKKQLFDADYERRKTETGDRVKKRREELGYTRPELSKMTGLAESTISFIEQGRSTPNLETLLLLCQSLKVSSDYIIGLRLRNYDDVMQDAKTAHLVRRFLMFSKRHKDEVLWFIEAVSDRIRKHGD